MRPLIAWFRGEPPKKVKEGKAEGEAERPAEKEKLSSLEPTSEVRHRKLPAGSGDTAECKT